MRFLKLKALKSSVSLFILILFILSLIVSQFSNASAETLTLGNTNIGGSTDSNDSNYINSSRFTTGSAGGTVSSISAYVGNVANNPNNQFQAAIYSDAGGTPGTLIASSSSHTLTSNSWNTAIISATLQPNTPYWLSYNTNGKKRPDNNLKYNSGGLSAFTSSSVPFGTWPLSYGSAVIGTANFSIYATYETSTPSPTPTNTPTPTPTTNPSITPTPTPSITSTPTPTPTPPSGGSTPILIITDPGNKYTSYYTEILKAEGFNSFDTLNISSVNASSLSGYDVAILGEKTLTSTQAAMFEDYVNNGGNLIAMRPDKKLANLLGLTDENTTQGEGSYLLINTSTGPGVGLSGETIQYHGTADKYMLNGASILATLYSDENTPTNNPAVSLNHVGLNGGDAAAFTFDLARSIILTRQGNPAWAGQNINNVDTYEASEMFDGYHRGLPDWNNLDKSQIPIADEQQRLLGNLIIQINADKKPLPHFWYFPRDLKAVVVMTGDDHGLGGTEGRFNNYIASSPSGCSVENWECIRSSSYVSNSVRKLTNAEALNYTNLGFEVGLHVTTNCKAWGTAADLDQDYSSQLSTWISKYISIPAPSSSRTHCVEWDDWATQPKTKLNYGMRLDTDYYYYPSNWVRGKIGLFNGTGLMMRFADLDGSLINVFQATTQMTDESGLSYPLTINTLLDNALGPQGYYGAFTANMHTDRASSAGSDAIVSSALNRGVPIISGRQMLAWLDGRDQSRFTNVSGTVNSLLFTVTGGTNGLRGMVPANSSSGGVVNNIIFNGSFINYVLKTVKGVTYAIFTALPGNYSVSYSQ